MISLEEKFSPKPGPRDKFRDYFNAGLLAVLSVLLLPAWLSWGGEFQLDIAGQMASGMLPAAMGFMLALRCGAIDLSIWMVMSETGVLAAVLINAGLDPSVAFLISGLLGLSIGFCNAILVALLKIPSILATPVVALAGMGIMRLLYDRPAIIVADHAFDGWVLGISNILALPEEAKADLLGPLLTVRMLLVAAGWTAVLVVLMLADSYSRSRPDRPISHRKSLFFSLCASGGLAGVSGMCWLLDLGQVSIATRLVDSLAIPTAVIMAGGILLAGKGGRTMLVGILMPLALLLTNAWSQTIWPLQIAGHYAQMPALLVLTCGVDLTFLWTLNHASRARWLAWIATGLTVAGLLIIPFSCLAVRSLHPRIYFIGLTLWACGLAILPVSIFLSRCGKRIEKTI